MSETLESLRASFNRSLRVEGKAERTVTIYGDSAPTVKRLAGVRRKHAPIST